MVDCRSRLLRSCRSGAPGAPAIPRGAVPPPKRHGGEPAHHSGVANKRTHHQRPRNPSPAGVVVRRRATRDRRRDPSCTGHSHAMPLNRHTPEYVVSVPIEFHEVANVRSAGAAPAVHDCAHLRSRRHQPYKPHAHVALRALTRQPRLRQLRVRCLSSAECRPAHG